MNISTHLLRSLVVPAGISCLALIGNPVLASSGITVKASFTGANGSRPYGLTDAGGGIYYGLTYSGGLYDAGGIYEFNSATGAITPKDSFNLANGGAYGTLTAAGGGIYYGTTIFGGTSDLGTVYEFNSATGAITLKDSFNGANGSQPYGSFPAAGGGIYYGTASFGGASDMGTVFEFNSATGAITLKDSFNRANGNNPSEGLTAAGGGIFYGRALSGGANNHGSIFEFSGATGAITLRASFNGANGSGPYSDLTDAGGGIYYGTTHYGGLNNTGAIYEFNSATGAITLKASFMDASTPYPWALTAAGGDIYYGTTLEGGANGFGFIYAFNSASGAISVVESFDGANGSNPSAALTAAGNGIFYGTTSSGGAAGLGTVFEFNANSPTNTVPGPLPLVGAAAAFHCSRRLRRRVRSVGGSHRLRPMAPTPAASPSAANPPA